MGALKQFTGHFRSNAHPFVRFNRLDASEKRYYSTLSKNLQYMNEMIIQQRLWPLC